jgi:hypothetical protein
MNGRWFSGSVMKTEQGLQAWYTKVNFTVRAHSVLNGDSSHRAHIHQCKVVLVHSKKTWGGEEVQLQLFLTTAQDGGG